MSLGREKVGNPGLWTSLLPPPPAPTHTHARAVASRTQDYFYLGGLWAAHIQSGAFTMATTDVISLRSQFERAGSCPPQDGAGRGWLGPPAGEGEEGLQDWGVTPRPDPSYLEPTKQNRAVQDGKRWTCHPEMFLSA